MEALAEKLLPCAGNFAHCIGKSRLYFVFAFSLLINYCFSSIPYLMM